MRGIVSAMAPDIQEKSSDNSRAGEASTLVIERSLDARDYPSLLALQGRLPTLIPFQFHRRQTMAKITRTNPEGISKPFSNYSHVVTAEGAQKLVF